MVQLGRWASRSTVMVALLVAAASRSGAGWAQTPSGDATRLFDEGKALYEAKDFTRACDALQKSERLDPAVGTLGLLAACYEQLGKVATAYRTYVDAADRASAVHDQREHYARERAAALRPRLPVLTVRGDPSISDLSATCDGKAVGLGAPLFVDPGPHRVEATAPGRKPWLAEVVAKEGAPLDVQVPALDPAPAPAPSQPPAVAPAQPAPAAGNDAASASGSSVQTTVGWVTLGVGTAGMAFGAIAGALALSKKSALDEDPQCPDHCADADAVASYNTVRVMSGVGFVGGGALAAAGVVLLLTAPSPAHRGARRPSSNANHRITVAPLGLAGASLTAPF